MLAAASIVLLALVASSEARTAYIVGGEDVDAPGKYPWQASLQVFGDHMCGASIISDQWLVTAGHCIEYPAHYYKVIVGAHDLKMKQGDPKVMAVAKTFVHPGYRGDFVYGRGQFPDDIALLKLSGTIEFTKNVAAIKLDKVGVPVGTTCIISGWGYMARNGWLASPNTLQEATTDLISNTDCKRSWGERMIAVNHQCVKSRASACMGDSGGPLACRYAGEWLLSGATSWGHPQCASYKPQMYSRISHFYKWIVKVSGVTA